jgi:hypothetical protein
MDGEGVQLLENVLNDSSVPHVTRRKMLATAAAAAAATAALPSLASAQGSSFATLGDAAATAEALAVTYLTNLIQKSGSAFPTVVQNVLKAANAAEADHYSFLTGAGFKPLTTRFWIPAVAFKPSVAPVLIEYLEQTFVNFYLIATTAFAAASKASLARYTVEIGGVEMEHRTLARLVQKKLPDDLAFTSYLRHDVSQIVQDILATGVGLGKQGSGTPGSFYAFPGSSPPASTVTTLDNTMVDQPEQGSPVP